MHAIIFPSYYLDSLTNKRCRVPFRCCDSICKHGKCKGHSDPGYITVTTLQKAVLACLVVFTPVHSRAVFSEILADSGHGDFARRVESEFSAFEVALITIVMSFGFVASAHTVLGKGGFYSARAIY